MSATPLKVLPGSPSAVDRNAARTYFAIKDALHDDNSQILASAIPTGLITTSMLAVQTASKAVVTTAGGLLTTSAATDTEVGYLAGVTSAIQTQINSKGPAITGGASTIATANLTANKALASDVSGKVVVSATTDTELGYLSGVSSAIQTQINSKQATLTGGASSVATANLTVNKAVVSDASGKITTSATTDTQIGYLSGASGTTGTTTDKIVFSTSPVLTTPNIGAATATSVNKLTLTAPASSATLTLADGSSLVTSGAFSTTLTSTATTVSTLPAGTHSLAPLDSPSFTTPTLGVASATSVNKVTITAPATSATLTIVDGGSLITAGAFATTLTSTATTNATLPAGTKTLVATDVSSLSSLATVGTISSGTWKGTGIDGQYLLPEQASIVGASSAINTTETVIVKNTAMAANRLQAGTVIRAYFMGSCTSSAANVSTFTIRIGTTGTVASDGLMISCATAVAATSGTSIPFRACIDMTVRTTGSSATCHGYLTLWNAGTTGISTVLTQVVLGSFTTFNTTTANNIISACYKSAANTTTSTFQDAYIEFVNK